MSKTIFHGQIQELANKLGSLRTELWETGFDHLEAIIEQLGYHYILPRNDFAVRIISGFQNDVTWFEFRIDLTSGAVGNTDAMLELLYKEMGRMPHIDVQLTEACGIEDVPRVDSVEIVVLLDAE